MRTSRLTRLLAGVSLFLGLALATPANAQKSRVSRPTAPAAPCRLYYTWSGGPGGLVGSGVTAAEFRACGLDAILAAADSTLAYGWLVQPLTEDGVRAALAPVVQAADGMPVWLSLSCVTQAGALNPGAPARTFYDFRNGPHRAMALANLETISRVAAELGISRLGFDFEAYGVTSWAATYPTPKARKIGAELAAAARRGNPSVQLFGLCPLSFYARYPGARALFRGWYGAAGAGGVFLNEDAYGMQGNVPGLLAWTHQFTQARNAAAGWFASDRAASGAAWFYDCAPQLRAAVQSSPFLLVYREGPALWGTRPDLRDAAGAVLRGLAPQTQ